ADCDDVQINFGVILNEAMADAVKITVIATGFQPENAPAVVRRSGRGDQVVSPPVISMPPPISEPVPTEYATVAPPEPATSTFDPDDLDTPAYLRQGRLLN